MDPVRHAEVQDTIPNSGDLASSHNEEKTPVEPTILSRIKLVLALLLIGAPLPTVSYTIVLKSECKLDISHGLMMGSIVSLIVGMLMLLSYEHKHNNNLVSKHKNICFLFMACMLLAYAISFVSKYIYCDEGIDFQDGIMK